MSQVDMFGVSSSSLAHYKQVPRDPMMVYGVESPPVDYTPDLSGPKIRGRYDPPLPSRVETWFRHVEWQEDRTLVLDALRAVGMKSARIDRFECCGSMQVVEWSPVLRRHRVRGWFCGDRFCKPCSKSRAAAVRARVLALAAGHQLRFMTFARDTKGADLRTSLNDLFSCFREMREDGEWTDHVFGGAGVIEVKRGAKSGDWHPHFHCLCTGRRWDQERFSATWLRATDHSPVVDIRFVYDEERGAGYVCKYASKGFHPSVLACPADLRECIGVLRGRRLLNTFGDWYGRVADDAPPADGGWEFVRSIESLVRGARAGDVVAQGILHSARGGRGLEVSDAPAATADEGE